jgi:hypothetical protein
MHLLSFDVVVTVAALFVAVPQCSESLALLLVQWLGRLS